MKTPILLLLMLGVAPIATRAVDTPPLETVTVRATARFGFDQATLNPQDRDAILAEVASMANVSWQTVRATGHADAVGAADYNDRLSARRADAVKDYLVEKGLDAGMIATAAMGSSTPVADNATASGRAQNRRAEIVFQGVRPMNAAAK